jgi:hypothetical protein
MTQHEALDILIRNDMWGLVPSRRSCLTQAVQVIAPVVDEAAPNATPLDTDGLRSLIWSAKEVLEADAWDMSPNVLTGA